MECKESIDTENGQKKWWSELRTEGPAWARVITGIVRGYCDSGNTWLQVLLACCKKMYATAHSCLFWIWRSINSGPCIQHCCYSSLYFVHRLHCSLLKPEVPEELESRDQQQDQEGGTEQETKWWWALMIQMRAPLEKITWQQYEDTCFLW